MKNDTPTSPRVSIAIPVYNGENYLKEAIESHLAQSYEDFELLVSDNASTDGTQAICEYYAKQDKRVKHIRHEVNIGAANNFTDIVDKAAGEYFKWSSHDDVVYSKDFIKSCVEKLDSDPNIILCTAKEVAINNKSEVMEDYMNKYPVLKHVESDSIFWRFRDLTCLNHGCYKVFGVMRTDVLKKTPKLANYIGADRVLLAELALMGPFWESPEAIHFRRHEEQYCAIDNDSERISWYSPKNKGKAVYTNATNCVEYIKSINRVPLSLWERALCYLVMIDWLRVMRKRLFKEGLRAIRNLV